MERRSSYRALIVEDDGAILNLVKIVLERENFTVEGVKTASAAIQLLGTVAYDLLILDLMLPDIGGEAGSAISRRPPTAPAPGHRDTASPGRMTCDSARIGALAKPSTPPSCPDREGMRVAYRGVRRYDASMPYALILSVSS